MVTATRIEYDALEAMVREKRRIQFRAQNALRYESTNLGDAVANYKNINNQAL